MSIKPLFAPASIDTSAASARHQQPETIRVPLKAGEHLSPKQFLQRAVMIALETTDVKKADEFLRQSGLERHVLPASEKTSGQTSLPFKTDEKFWKSIENFKQTGTALPLAEVKKQSAAALPDSTLKTGGKAARPIAAEARTSERRGLPPAVRSDAERSDGASRGGTRVSPEVARQGKDGGRYYVKIDPNEFVDVGTGKTKVIDKDERKEVLARAIATAAKELKYSPETIAKYLETFDDTNSVVSNGNPQTAEGLRKNLLESAEAGKLHDFYLSSNGRNQLYRIEVDLHGSQQEKLQVKVEDELTKIDEKYAAVKPENDLQKAALALAQDNEKKAAIDFLVGQAKDVRGEQSWQENIANQAVDFLEKAARFSVDNHPLYRFLPEEAKKQIVDFQIGIGRGTVGLVGAVKGVGDFFEDAATDALLYSAKETGLDKSLGIDVDKIQAGLKVKRGEDAKLWSNLANASTERIAKNQLAYDIKKDAGINLTIYDTPNWAVKGGEITAQAVPFIAVGVATGGASIPASMAIAAGTGAFVAGGTTYSQTRQYEPALKAAVIGAAQGAVIPLSGALGKMAGGVAGELFADAAANTAFVYTVGKLQGRNDAEIGQDIVLQLAQGGAFRIGGGVHKAMQQRAGKTLATEAAVQSEFQKLQQQPEFMGAVKQTVAESAGKQTENFVRQTEIETVAKSLERQRATAEQKPAQKPTVVNARIAERNAQGATARGRIKTQASEIVSSWGKNNKVVNRAQAEQARVEIQKYLRQSATRLTMGVDPSVLPTMAVRAAFHVEAGARSFAEFSKVMIGEFGGAIKPRLEQLYTNAAKNDNTVVDNEGIAAAKKAPVTLEEANLLAIREKLPPAAQDQFDLMRIKQNNDGRFAQIIEKNGDALKMFEGMARNEANKATASQREDGLQAKLDAARTQIDRPNFVNRWLTQKALRENDVVLLREQISVEMTKQELSVKYPASKGYEIQAGVKIYKDSGFQTIAEWQAAHPDLPANAVKPLIEADGKVWQPITDADIAIVQKTANGKNEIVHLEQIKSGKNDLASKARGQLDNTLDALRKIATNDPNVRVYETRNSQKVDTTSEYDLSRIDKAEAVTRGADDRQHFDQTLGATSKQIDQLANELLTKYKEDMRGDQ